MSEAKTDRIVRELIRDAERTNDPAKLYAIGDKLQHVSAWDEARHVYLKARELQMQMEQVMK